MNELLRYNSSIVWQASWYGDNAFIMLKFVIKRALKVQWLCIKNVC
jgi:hypothetical protein